MGDLELDVFAGVHERKSKTENNLEEGWKISIEEFKSKLKSEEELGKLPTKSQRMFYKRQNELVNSLIEVEDHSTNFENGSLQLNEEEEELASKALNRAKNFGIYGSLITNVLLLVIKIVAAIISGSLSVMASAVDSFLDIFSGAIMSLTEYMARKSREEDYPAGTSRFEPVGIVIFSACMFTATFQLFLTSIETLITKSSDLDVTFVVMLILGCTIVSKFCLWMYCRLIPSESCQTLAMDHRNDVISNIFGAATALIGYYWEWWVDPIGAIVISSFLMSVWARNGYSQLRSLLGKSASPTVLQTLTYVARNHHPDVLAIDTVRAYHYGYNYLVELDIVLPGDMPLHIAHDIGESLQNKLEALEKVERAFVHLDYETSHSPEHKPSRRTSEANLLQSSIDNEKGSLLLADDEHSEMI